MQQPTEPNKGNGANGRLDLPPAVGAVPMPNIDPLFQITNKWLETQIAIFNEIVEFGMKRLDRQAEMRKAMTKTQDVNEAVQAIATFARSAVEDYADEAKNIANLAKPAIVDNLKSLQRSMQESAQHAAKVAELNTSSFMGSLSGQQPSQRATAQSAEFST